MKLKVWSLIVMGLYIVFSVAISQAYDIEVAKKANSIFSMMDRKTLATSPCKVKPDIVLKWIKDGEKVTILDIRTPEETAIAGITYKNSLRIPLNELFKEENLNRLPEDGKIVIVCHSGFRGGAAAAILRLIGIQNVVVLEGGLIEFVRALTPLTAP